MILDADKNSVCITETTKVYICPFMEVSKEHAFKEGVNLYYIGEKYIKIFSQMNSKHMTSILIKNTCSL